MSKISIFKFSVDDIVAKLKEIALNESILVSEEVLFEIARLSDGGLRDAINMLDQLSSFKSGDLNIQDVYRLNGDMSYNEFKKLLHFTFINDIVSIVDFFENIDKTGKSFERFIEYLISFLKDILIAMNTNSISSNVKEKEECINFLVNLYTSELIYKFIILLNDISIRIKNSSFAKILLITEFIKFSNDLNLKNVEEKNTHEDNNISNKDTIQNNIKVNEEFIVKKNNGITDKIKKIRINNTFSTASKEYKEEFLKKWNLVLETVSNNCNYVSIAGMLSDVEVLVVG